MDINQHTNMNKNHNFSNSSSTQSTKCESPSTSYIHQRISRGIVKLERKSISTFYALKFLAFPLLLLLLSIFSFLLPISSRPHPPTTRASEMNNNSPGARIFQVGSRRRRKWDVRERKPTSSSPLSPFFLFLNLEDDVATTVREQ